jgi:hypothetical protein
VKLAIPVLRAGRSSLVDAVAEELQLERRRVRGARRLAEALLDRLEHACSKFAASQTVSVLSSIAPDVSDRSEALAPAVVKTLAELYRGDPPAPGADVTADDIVSRLERAIGVTWVDEAKPDRHREHIAIVREIAAEEAARKAASKPARKKPSGTPSDADVYVEALRQHVERFRREVRKTGKVDDDLLDELDTSLEGAMDELADMLGATPDRRPKRTHAGLARVLSLSARDFAEKLETVLEDDPDWRDRGTYFTSPSDARAKITRLLEVVHPDPDEDPEDPDARVQALFEVLEPIER